MTTMRDCTNPEHALAYDRMRATEQSWLQAWREATGQRDAIPEYGVMLTWLSEQHAALVARLTAIEEAARVVVADSNEPLQRVDDQVVGALRATLATPEPPLLTFAKAAARHRGARTC